MDTQLPGRSLDSQARLADEIGALTAALDSPEVRASLDGVKGIASFMNLVAAQAAAAETRAEDAANAAHSVQRRAARTQAAVEQAAESELESLERFGRAVADAFKEARDSDPDALARMLEVPSYLETESRFDAWMRNDDETLVLGPGKVGTLPLDSASRLERVASRLVSPPLDRPATETLLERTWQGHRLTNSADAGTFLRAEAHFSVLVGDGTLVSSLDSKFAARKVPSLTSGPCSGQVLAAHRFATGGAPCLRRHAIAGLAVSLSARGASVPGGDSERENEGELCSWMLLGASLPLAASRPSALDLSRPLWDVMRAMTKGNKMLIGAACLRLVHVLARVSVYEDQNKMMSGETDLQPAVDVGRVFWSSLSGSPLVWLPVFPDDPDTVGGGDRPWTLDPPAAGATWHSAPPTMQVDTDWYGRVMLVPGERNLCCLGPDGSWWSLETDYESVVESRRTHVRPWLEALEEMEADIVARLEALERAGYRVEEEANDDRPTREKRLPAKGSEPEPFSTEWIVKLADRYSYRDDSAPRAAGASAVRRGYYTRSEFLAVVHWKSARSVPLAERNSQAAVKGATASAFAAEDELVRVSALLRLNGVGLPIASALLHFAYPDDYPILDFRALDSLGMLVRPDQYSPEFWERYVRRCREIAEGAGVSIRILDKALWQRSKERPQGR